MDISEKNETQGVNIKEDFQSLATNIENKTNIGEIKESFNEKNNDFKNKSNGPRYAEDFVNSFEKNFAVSTFILIIIGYIVINAFGKNDFNLWQYVFVLFAASIALVGIKFNKIIFDYIKQINKYWLYIFLILVILILIVILFHIYGKPKIIFLKKNYNCKQELIIKSFP